MSNMTTRCSPEELALIRFYKNESDLSVRKIAQKVKKSPSTAYHTLMRMQDDQSCQSLTSRKRKGRPMKISEKQRRRVIRGIHHLRRTEGNFTARRLMQEATISEQEISVHTVQRFLNKKGYYYLQARKKGLITSKDMKHHVCNEI